MKIGFVQHVSVPRPPGEREHERAMEFYAGVLGFEPIPKPRTFTSIEVSWFRHGEQEIHVYAMNEGEPPVHSAAHFCITVDDIVDARRHLERSGYQCDVPVTIPHRPRFSIRDPFGNQIEVTTIEGEYTAP